MNDKKIKAICSSLVHDIGKVIYRSGEKTNHSEGGYKFLKEEVGMADKDILDAVRYHHYAPLSRAGLADDSVAYITYMADNIASAGDRRDAQNGEPGFAKSTPLESVFNLLNNNNKKLYYRPGMLDDSNNAINYPTETKEEFGSAYYSAVREKFKNLLKTIDFSKPIDQYETDRYINSLLELTEALCTYIPSSTSTEQVADISLYDHSKLTAAFAGCIYTYLEANSITDYRTELFKNSNKFYDKKVFLLYSLDISGIQKFIYTINVQGALKDLRARSFYLEIFMEHILDELLTQLEYSRANIIYTGGGHCYLILANTDETKSILDRFEKTVNKWLIDNFATGLYIAGGYAQCSSNDIQNKPDGSYAELFAEISRSISRKKLHRYSAQEILALNSAYSGDGKRECKCCKSPSHLIKSVSDNGIEEYRCEFCNSINKLSNDILTKEYFTVLRTSREIGIKLPFGCRLVSDNEKSLKDKMQNDIEYVRCYCKGKMNIGQDVSTHLWVGDYHSKNNQTDELAKSSTGISRIAVLRADVDNLGRAFVRGFNRNDCGAKYVTLSRTASLSRQLSLFFKHHINSILKTGSYGGLSRSGERNISIVYSGGDDVFVVGAWDDVISFAVDLTDSFNKFTEGTLTISAGIGLYDPTFPISISAQEVDKLESLSKSYTRHGGNEPEKNAVTLFDAKDVFKSDKLSGIELKHTYSWDEFKNKVISEKLDTLKEFFGFGESKKNSDNDFGASLLYNLVFLLRNSDTDKINYARYVYLLSRMEPSAKNGKDKEDIDKYKKFSGKMYEWIKNPTEKKQLLTAIYIYAYLIRKRGD